MEKCKQWLSPLEVSKVYGISVSTLAKSRMVINGTSEETTIKIPYSKFGRYIKYNVSDIEDFLNSHKVN